MDVPAEGVIDNVPADVPEADKPEANIPVEDLLPTVVVDENIVVPHVSPVVERRYPTREHHL